MEAVAVVVDDDENLGVNDVWNLAFASRSLFEDLVVCRPSVALLHPIGLHVGEVAEALVHFMVIAALEDDVVNASIFGCRYVEWNRSNHQLMADASFLRAEKRELKLSLQNQLRKLVAQFDWLR